MWHSQRERTPDCQETAFCNGMHPLL
jgi:hypothetical protein